MKKKLAWSQRFLPRAYGIYAYAFSHFHKHFSKADITPSIPPGSQDMNEMTSFKNFQDTHIILQMQPVIQSSKSRSYLLTRFIHFRLTKIPRRSNFPDNIKARNFIKIDTSGQNILALYSLNVKFPDDSLTFLQNFSFPTTTHNWIPGPWGKKNDEKTST